MAKHIHNRVAEGGFTLPAFGLFALLLWRPWRWMDEPLSVLPLLPLLLAGYVLMEWCNRHQVIRVRSRLCTSLFVLGASAICHMWLCTPVATALPLAVVCCMAAMSSCYDRRHPVVEALHAAFALSVGSLLVPPLLWLLPVLFFCLTVYMRAMSLRTFSATIMGAALPWAVMGTWWMMRGELDSVNLGTMLPHFNYAILGTPIGVSWIVASLMGIVAVLRYFSRSYDDKIRVRMIFHCIILFWCSVQVLVILFPHHLHTLLPALWLLTSPLLAHQLALSSSRWGTLWFAVVMAALIGAATYTMLL